MTYALLLLSRYAYALASIVALSATKLFCASDTLRQHRTMGATGFGGSFAPIVQYEKWEIHPVFPHFSYFRLCQNLSPNLLAPLCGVALSLSLQLSGLTVSNLINDYLHTFRFVATYFPNKSLCVPVRASVSTRTSSSMRYTRSQSGRIWHSLCPTQSPVST